MEEHERTRFLPPQPAGPEPELSGRPQAPPPPPPAPPPPAPQTHGYPPPWAYPQPQVPDNGQAVTGFVFSLVGVGLLVISFGLSTILSLGCAIVGIICSRNGKRKVDSGETPKHRGLAQAGYIIGWVGLGLSLLATIGWIVAIAAGLSGDDAIFDPETTHALRQLVWG